MASYVVIREAEAVQGSTEVLAVLIDDGKAMAVLGESRISDDLERRIGTARGKTPERRLGSLLSGFSHYHLDGPIPLDGTTASVAPVLSVLYGV